MWLEAYHRRDVVLQCLHSALDTETPCFRLSFSTSGPWPHDILISWYAWLWSNTAFSGCSVLTFRRLRSWRMWSEKWSKRCILTKLKSDSSTRYCAIFDLIYIVSLSMQLHLLATEWLFQAGSLPRSSDLSNVCCFFKASEIFFVDLQAWNHLNTPWWWWNTFR